MKMNLVFSSDDKGVDMMATAIYSVIENNQKHELTFYVLHSNITEENQARLKKLEDTFDNTKIKFIIPDSKRFDDIKVTNHKVTMEAYYRYLAPEILPKKETRALYMDIDMLCLSDLGDLYNTYLDGSYIGAVEDWVIMHSRQYNDFRQWFLTKNEGNYFNSGLLLLDLEKLRRGIMNTFWKNVHRRSILIPGKFDIFADQTITNITFNGKTEYLDKKYNSFTTALKDLKIKKPVIVHFTGSHKPLTYKDDYSVVFDKEYHKYYSNCMNIIGGNVSTLYRKAAEVLVRDAIADTRYEITIDKNIELADKAKELADKTREVVNKEQEIAMMHRQQRDIRFLTKRLVSEAQIRINRRAQGLILSSHLYYKKSDAISRLNISKKITKRDMTTIHKMDIDNIDNKKIAITDRIKPWFWKVLAKVFNLTIRIGKKVHNYGK